MKTKNPLEILIVEDREENLKAAKEYFDTQKDVLINIATNYEDGLKKLQNQIYAMGIFDLELPRTEKSNPEKLGFKLGKEAGKLLVPYCILTGGIDHGKPSAEIYIMDIMSNDEINKELAGMGIEKTNPNSWRKAHNMLKRYSPNIDKLISAKQRYLKYIGKLPKI